MKDTNIIIEMIRKQYEEITEKENTSNALDFIQEIKDYLVTTYNID